MRKQLVLIFLSALSLSFFSINSMELVKKVWSLISYNSSISQKEETLVIITPDGRTKVIPHNMLQYCNRLKLACYFYRNNKNKQLRVRFTKEEVDIICDAFQNPLKIDYDKNFSIIVKMAESFGAYLLYAYCVSDYLSKIGGSDVDKHKIFQFEQLMKYRIKTETDWLYTPYVTALTRNDHYYVERGRKIFGRPGNYYQENIVFNNNHEVVFNFSSHNTSYMKLNLIYVFKKRNVMLFFEKDQDINMTLYDLDKKKEITKLPGEHIDISNDENYIISFNHLGDKGFDYVVIYDITNFDNIKTAYIKGHFWGELAFVPHSDTFITDEFSNDDERIKLWRVSDLKWNDSKENVISYKLLIPNHFGYMKDFKFSDNGKYVYCQYRKNEAREIVCRIINLETFEDILFPDKKDISDYTLMEYTNLLYKENPLEIYELSDLSQPLYSDKDKGELRLKYRSPGYLEFQRENGFSCLLRYDKELKNIKIEQDMIEGWIHDVREDGLMLVTDQESWAEKAFLYYPDGSKIELLDAKKNNINFCNCELSGTSDEAYLYIRKNDRYVRQSFNIHTQLCSRLTYAQQAFLDTIFFDVPKDNNDMRRIEHDSLLRCIYNTFAHDTQQLIQNGLK